MASSGTGLPIPKTERVLVQPNAPINADAYSNAQSWASIAAACAQIENIAPCGLFRREKGDGERHV